MPNVHQTAPHESDSPEALSRTDRASVAPRGEQRRWQVIVLLEQRATLAEIMAATGYRPRTIREIAQRYRQFGPVALVDQRAHSLGAPPILGAEQQHELRQALQQASPDGGVWTGPKVAQWIAAKTGRHVHRQRGWDYLRRLTEVRALTHADSHAAQPQADADDRPV
jgi:transposase